jgi:alkanesulfonate monooxygenase SsuD/methylene tetrahydromethanopterin reductase-like flavin-dependent oxidoreductase (luciferase family)
VWLGGWSEHILALAGARALGWNGWGGTPARLRRAAETVVAGAGGRAVEISWGGQALLDSTDARAVAKLGPRDPRAFAVGGPERIAALLAARVAAGARHLVLGFPDGGDRGPYELLAGEVVPLLGDLTTYPPGV